MLRARFPTAFVLAIGLACGGEAPVQRPALVIQAIEPPEETEPMGESSAVVTPPREPPRPWTPRIDCERKKERGYRKGKGFAIEVISIDQRLVEVDTARAYLAMQHAAASDGVALPIYSGFRTQAEQKYFFDCYRTCSCNNCNKATRPGYSNHQSGRAIDFGLWDGTEDWLRQHAKEYGFRRTVRREPWHYEFNGSKRVLKKAPELCPAADYSSTGID